MNFEELAFTFECEGNELIGIVSHPDSGTVAQIGVLIVVGGPQYRVGSHRQFVLLARYLATNGFACMRFDCRGMGDGGGEQRSFEVFHEDIGRAVDAFQVQTPGVTKVVLWGLCDGASAAAMYAPSDARVVGLILLNPWVRSEATEARTYIKHYYARRVLSKAFWEKLFRGQVSIFGSLGGFMDKLLKSRTRTVGTSAMEDMNSDQSLSLRMLNGIRGAACPTLVCLSRTDYVAREFEEAMQTQPLFASLCLDGVVTVEHFEGADHTFSSESNRDAVAQAALRHVVCLRSSGA